MTEAVEAAKRGVESIRSGALRPSRDPSIGGPIREGGKRNA